MTTEKQYKFQWCTRDQAEQYLRKLHQEDEMYAEMSWAEFLDQLSATKDLIGLDMAYAYVVYTNDYMAKMAQ